MKRILSLISLVFCCTFLFLAATHILQRIFPRAWHSNSSGINTQTSIPHIPVRLRIAKIGIDLPVYSVKRIGNSWEISNKGVSYLRSSALPEEAGMSIFYGHNWPNLLGNLSSLTKDSEVEVFLADGRKIVFIIDKLQVVSAKSSISLQHDSDKKMIVIYTCAGLLDTQRFIAYGILRDRP